MAFKLSIFQAFFLLLASPLTVVSYVLEKRAFQINYKVAIAALTAISGTCATGAFLNCLVAAVGSVAVVIISGFSSGSRGNSGGPVARSSSLISTVQHFLPNGTVARGFHPRHLVVGEKHKVTVGDYFHTTATRLESGHVHISALVNQYPDTWYGSFLKSVHQRRTDDDPGNTRAINAYYYDADIGGTELQNDGGTDALSRDIGETVGNGMINDQAETVCAQAVNPDTNGEIFTTEWYLEAGDGTVGSTPSGACNNAQNRR